MENREKAMTFAEYAAANGWNVEVSTKWNGTTHLKYKFPNGYGASVISDGYGSEEGLLELAVLGKDGRLCYDTPITDDVLGWLTFDEVFETLKAISALPAA